MMKSMILCSFPGFQINSFHRPSLFNSYLPAAALSLSNQRFLHLNIMSQRLQRKFAVCNCIQPGLPLPSGPPSDPSWRGWILGIVVTFLLPFLANKWGPLLKIKNKVDSITETAERVADAVEKVAEEVEKVTEDIADDLPAGKLKNAALRIEQLAEATDKNAELIGDFIDKVQDMEESIEKIVESRGNEKADTSKEAKDV